MIVRCALAVVPLLAAVGVVAGAAGAAPRALSGEERTGLRCAAAFALVAGGQARGEAEAQRYPPMVPRGREFFVRLSAQLMDDAGLDANAIRAATEAEAADLRRTGGVGGVMGFCLGVLDAQPGLGAGGRR